MAKVCRNCAFLVSIPVNAPTGGGANIDACIRNAPSPGAAQNQGQLWAPIDFPDVWTCGEGQDATTGQLYGAPPNPAPVTNVALQINQQGPNARINDQQQTLAPRANGLFYINELAIRANYLRFAYSDTATEYALVGGFYELNTCLFTGSIAGAVLTVSAVASGALAAGMTIDTPTGRGVLGFAFIESQLTGTAGGVGTYQLNVGNYNFPNPGALAGMSNLLPFKVAVPNLGAGPDFTKLPTNYLVYTETGLMWPLDATHSYGFRIDGEELVSGTGNITGYLAVLLCSHAASYQAAG